MNHAKSGVFESAGEIVVTLDCQAVIFPSGRLSLNSIRSRLETMALAKQRILGEMLVDGVPVDFSAPPANLHFQRVDAATVTLAEMPVLLLTLALNQAGRARAAVESALTQVLINDSSHAREIWWDIAGQLKEPVLTLSLMPENLCQAWCGTSFQKLRRWQLEQISIIVKRVDETCGADDNIPLSDALENLVLPWLDRLGDHIRLWHDTAQAGARLAKIGL